MEKLETKPVNDGLFIPAEWEEHDCCWMSWPHMDTLWDEDGLTGARRNIAAIARTLAEFETVRMMIREDDHAEAVLQCARKVEFLEAKVEDLWIGDVGPSFVIDGMGGVAGVDWDFNAWGVRLPNYHADENLSQALLGQLGMRRYEGPMVLEGGAISVDGSGTLLATEECLLGSDRNPLLDRERVEATLGEYFGVLKIVWLENGLYGDLNEGQVCKVARFARPGVVLAHDCMTLDDPDYPLVTENMYRLHKATDTRGREFEVIPVPAPEKNRSSEVNGAAISYLDFFIANGGVIVPGFDDPADGKALEIISNAFPDRKAVQIPILELAAGGAGIHSAILAQPKGKARG